MYCNKIVNSTGIILILKKHNCEYIRPEPICSTTFTPQSKGKSYCIYHILHWIQIVNEIYTLNCAISICIYNIILIYSMNDFHTSDQRKVSTYISHIALAHLFIDLHAFHQAFGTYQSTYFFTKPACCTSFQKC